MGRREFTRDQRAQIVMRATNERGVVCCEGCGLVLGKKPYEIDHTMAEGLAIPGGSIVDSTKRLTIADGKLLGKECCHRAEGGKTASDVKAIAQAKRRQAKDLGTTRKRSTFAGSRDSRFKKLITGEVVDRRTGELVSR